METSITAALEPFSFFNQRYYVAGVWKRAFPTEVMRTLFLTICSNYFSKLVVLNSTMVTILFTFTHFLSPLSPLSPLLCAIYILNKAFWTKKERLTNRYKIHWLLEIYLIDCIKLPWHWWCYYDVIDCPWHHGNRFKPQMHSIGMLWSEKVVDPISFHQPFLNG